MGSCVGGLSKFESLPERTSIEASKRTIDRRTSHNIRQWSWSSGAEEHNTDISRSLVANLLSAPNTVSERMRSPEEAPNNNNNLFINEAAVSWNEMRREWVGDQSKRSYTAPKEQMISWSTTYEDLLSTDQLFSQPIPLSEMVDFLVDIWHEEGLYEQ